MCMPHANQPDIPAQPAPTPSPTPADVSPQTTESQRQAKNRKLKQGMMSTIKTSPSGVMGEGSDLSNNTGKKTLGGA